MLQRVSSFLLLSIAFSLPVHAQVKKTTTGSPQKTTTAQNTKTKPAAPKAGTTVKQPVAANMPAKDTVKVKQAVMPDSSQAPVARAPDATMTPVVPVAETVKKADPAIPMPSPFKAGTLRLSHQSMVVFQRYNFERSTDNGKDNYTDANIDVTWFPVNGLGIGVDAGYDKYSYNDSDGYSDEDKSWSARLHLLYGYSFNNRYHAFVQAGYGPTKEHSIYTTPDYTHDNIYSNKELVVSAGAPIRIEKEGRLFVTPAFSYDRYKGTRKTDGSIDSYITNTTKGFYIKLESYLPLTGNSKKPPVNYYTRGNNFIDYNSRFESYKTKKLTSPVGGSGVSGDINHITFLHGGYGLYFMDNIAGILNVEFRNRRGERSGSDDVRKYVTLQPGIVAQLPVEGPLNHLFGEVSYEFGRGNEGGTKTKESNLYLRAGYHFFMTQNLALTPRIGYTMEKYDPGGALYVTKSKGLAGEIVIRSWLGWKWMK
jgi:hypothetical protein